MGKIIRKNVISSSGTIPEFNVSKIRAMSEEEAVERAKKDPDAPLIDEDFIKKYKLRFGKLKKH